jgi:cell division protein ZapE
MELTTQYQELCQKNGFYNNSAQLDVIKDLEHFGNMIMTLKTKKSKQGFFADFLRLFLPSDPEILPLGVYIYGDVGRGKSMLMDLFYKNIPITHKKRIHFHAFMMDTHKMLRQARLDNAPDALLEVADKIAHECRLVCFDEFQVLDITDAMLLGRLFDALIKRGVKFVMTSNRPPDDLYLNGLNRQLFLPFIALLKTKFQITNLNHPTDFRQEKIKYQDHYLYPLNHKTHIKFEKIWHILTDYNHGNTFSLEHSGRVIKFIKSYKNIVHSDFHTLCDNPLGVSDYIAIAEKFSVLLLDNIPQLTADMRNQATRFRNLIDVFYDKRLKIYFRCAMPLEALYLKGDYAFEFERTLSRLQEMQAKDYGFL